MIHITKSIAINSDANSNSKDDNGTKSIKNKRTINNKL